MQNLKFYQLCKKDLEYVREASSVEILVKILVGRKYKQPLDWMCWGANPTNVLEIYIRST